MSHKVVIVCPTFNGVSRLEFMLRTVEENDPDAFATPWLITEDPCHNLGPEYAASVREGYDRLGASYDVPVYHIPEWSNMHGAARKGFDKAMELFDPEWIVYLGDDLGITPGALSNMIYFLTENALKSISLVGFPYWNAHDLSKNVEHSDWDGPKVFFTKEDDFYKDTNWTRKVPRNPHWEQGDGFPDGARPYVNVNGVGFACKAETYRKVGGFQEGTWCLDETISVKTWLRTDQSIVCLPGPPLVHYFGAATMAGPPTHDLHTAERWEESMGMTKAEADRLCRAAMAEREEACMAEISAANYWDRRTS